MPQKLVKCGVSLIIYPTIINKLFTFDCLTKPVTGFIIYTGFIDAFNKYSITYLECKVIFLNIGSISVGRYASIFLRSFGTKMIVPRALRTRGTFFYAALILNVFVSTAPDASVASILKS